MTEKFRLLNSSKNGGKISFSDEDTLNRLKQTLDLDEEEIEKFKEALDTIGVKKNGMIDYVDFVRAGMNRY